MHRCEAHQRPTPWKDIDQKDETVHHMQFWMKKLWMTKRYNPHRLGGTVPIGQPDFDALGGARSPSWPLPARRPAPS